MSLPVDLDEHLVTVQLVTGAWPTTAQPVGVGLAELSGPLHDGDENPNRVIGDKASFFVTVDWNLSPPDQAALLDGTWTVNLYAGSLGPGPEKKIGTATVGCADAVNGPW